MLMNLLFSWCCVVVRQLCLYVFAAQVSVIKLDILHDLH